MNPKLTCWLDKYVFDYNIDDFPIINIPKLGDCLFIEEKDGVVLDDELHPILSEDEQELLSNEGIKYLILQFGSFFYYCDLTIFERFGVVGNANNNFIPLKYFGQRKMENYAHLGVHGNYELLNGTGTYDEWCKKAKVLGIETLGICEKDTLAGVLKFQLACKKAKIKAIIGVNYSVKQGRIAWNFKLYVKSDIGWKNLLLINSFIKVINEVPFIDIDTLCEYAEGLIFVFDPVYLKYDKQVVDTICKHFDEVYYQVGCIEFSSENRDKEYLCDLKGWKGKLKPVLIVDSHYLEVEQEELYNSLNLIAGYTQPPLNTTKHFWNKGEMREYFEKWLFDSNEEFESFWDEILKNTQEISNLCSFQVNTSEWHFPQYEMTQEERLKYDSNETMFLSLVEDGLQREIKKRNLTKGEIQMYRERIDLEVDTIKYGDIIDYFLILWDIIKYCNANGILVGVGRGSAAGALVSFLIGITKINPLDWGLLFERFLTKGRVKELIKEDYIEVQIDGKINIDLDFDEEIIIIVKGNEKIIKASELKNGDKIVNSKKRDLFKV